LQELAQQVRASPIPIVFIVGGDPRDRRQRIGGRAVRKATRPSARPRSQSCDDCRVIRPEGTKRGNRHTTRRARRHDGAWAEITCLGSDHSRGDRRAICQAQQGTGGRNARDRQPVFLHSGGAGR
jgi:hypothetical protein